MTTNLNYLNDLPVRDLDEAIRGTLLTPGDPGYDDARQLFVRGLDRRPAAIARVADAEDVAAVVAVARDRGLELSVRAGGHGPAGHAVPDGALVIDLRDMTGLDIDVEGRTAWAQAGLTAGEYTTAVGAHGLATGFGDTSSVGLSGLTLAGGMGYLARKHGLTIDQLLAAEVVTADGRILHTDAETHPDLFWALRGGGGNLGVVTRLQFRLHEVGTITGGMLMLPASPAVLEGFVAAAEAAPEEVSAMANTMVAPPMPMVPAEAHGKPITMILIAHCGDPQDAEDALAPFRALAPAIVDAIQTMPYPALFEGPMHMSPAHESARSMFLDVMDHQTATAIIDHVTASTADMAVAHVRVLGGAMARVPDDATAFAHRQRRILIALGAVFEDAEQERTHDAWVTRAAEAIDQGVPGVYAGFLGDEGPARVREAYPGATWDRLADVKRRYDPQNLFHHTHNIPPAG